MTPDPCPKTAKSRIIAKIGHDSGQQRVFSRHTKNKAVQRTALTAFKALLYFFIFRIRRYRAFPLYAYGAEAVREVQTFLDYRQRTIGKVILPHS